MSHSEKLSSINLFQTKGLEGLAITSRFSRSAIKITEKATVVLVPIAMPCVWSVVCWTWCYEFSSSMSRKSFCKSFRNVQCQIKLIVIFEVTASNVNPFCLRDVCVKGVVKSTWSEICVLSIKLMRSVVSFRCNSCFVEYWILCQLLFIAFFEELRN